MKLIALALALAPAIAVAQEKIAPRSEDIQTMSDARIASTIHRVNKMEIDAGKLAVQHGTAAVKDLGQMLATDHQQWDDKLVTWAKRANVDLNTLTIPDQEKLAADEKKLDAVKALTGTAFDKAFASATFDKHQGVLDMLARSAADIRDPDLKQYVGDLRTVLERHKDQAGKLKGVALPMGRTPESEMHRLPGAPEKLPEAIPEKTPEKLQEKLPEAPPVTPEKR